MQWFRSPSTCRAHVRPLQRGTSDCSAGGVLMLGSSAGRGHGGRGQGSNSGGVLNVAALIRKELRCQHPSRFTGRHIDITS